MRHRKKYRFINGTKGMVSILLCIVISPFLTIASALIEFARYQGTAENVGEIIDCASFSTLADYDTYLQDRFGLFAVSQDCDISEAYEESVQGMTALLGKSAEFKKTTAKGCIPLSKGYAMRSQLMDFGENTVLTEVLLDDLNLEEIIAKLNQLEVLGKVADAVNDVADVAESLEGLVDKGEAFKESIIAVQNNITTVQTNIDTLMERIKNLCEKLSKNYVFDSLDEEGSLENLVNMYLNDITPVYSNAQALYDSLNTLYTSVENIPAEAQELADAVEEVKTKLQEINESAQSVSEAVESAADNEKKSSITKSSEKTSDALQAVVDALDEAFTEAVEQLKTDTVDSMRTAAEEFQEELKEAFKLDVYSSSYFSAPLSETAKEDLKEILSLVPEAWEEGSADVVAEKVKEIYLPNIIDLKSFENTVTNVETAVTGALSEAMNGLVENVNNGLSSILTSLIAAVEGIFSLELFSNPKLNAVVNESLLLPGEPGDDPLQELLNAIEKIKTAASEFSNSVGNLDLGAAIKAAAKLLRGVAEIFVSIKDIAKGTIDKIVELAGYLSDDNPTSLYDLLLMSAYMTHNLPNRTNADATSVNVDLGNGAAISTELNGSSLTGYDYNSIVRPEDGTTMFKGAELEYILGGTNNEKVNQTVAFMDIYMLRFLLNIGVVLTDADVGAMAAAATIASWVVYLLVMLGEPMVDTVFLVNGEEVFLIKNGCYLSPTGIGPLGERLIDIATSNSEVNEAFQEKWSQIQEDKLPKGPAADLDQGLFKMDYGIHMLLVIMMSVKEDNILRRFANLVQLESNCYYKDKGAAYTFDIKKAYSCMQTSTEVEYNSLIDVFQLNGKSVTTRTYTRMKGY